MAAMLLAGHGMATAQAGSAAADGAAATDGLPVDARPIHFFFLADVHSQHVILDRFIAAVSEHGPGLIVEGGDFVHDATAAEYRHALVARAGVGVPWRMTMGNHDAELRGPFPAPPPEIPAFQGFDHGELRFVLLDNHDGMLTAELFGRLEAELAAHEGRRIVVAMHVPPVLGAAPFATVLRHLSPFPLADPSMPDPGQVERFTGLMARYGVLAVLTGHAHYPYHEIRDGVHYIVAGAAGGLTPGPGIASEYLDITIDGRDVGVRRVVLADPPRNPVSFLVGAFRFYARLNRFNHAEQGWNYVPSASVQLRTGVGLLESRAGDNTVVLAVASFERILDGAGRRSLVADIGLTGGSRELLGQLVTGYKLRPVGAFNENVFLSGAATANAGALQGRATAGVGGRLGLGLEWRGVTVEASRNWATNLRATTVGIGHRF
jgi:predicted phosphodiesterase